MASLTTTDVKTAAVSGSQAVAAEIAGLERLRSALDGPLGSAFDEAVSWMLATKGRVIVTGMGKSGHIARKIASTLASTGTPAFFLHPGEASHGDLGMIAPGDVVLALSWTGESVELRVVIDYCKRFGARLIGLTSGAGSALGAAADLALVLPPAEEACPNRLAPTTSTTMQLALGDALAVALLEARGFSAADFRNFHPGGKLGARLVTVDDVMTAAADAPRVGPDAPISEAMLAMSAGRMGGVAVVHPDGRLAGAFTDANLRRSLTEEGLSARVADYMTARPVTVPPHTLATEAVALMNAPERLILLLFVTDGEKLVGAVHLHDLLRAGAA
jgi:arabinose-5-phosphate isomerase